MSDERRKASARLIYSLLFASGIMLMLLIALLVMSRQRDRATQGAVVQNADVYQGTIIDPPLVLDDFALPSSTGETVRLSDFRGKWVLLFFGFTHCPDICPLTLAEFARVLERLGDETAQPQVLFISVDGNRDTPDVLAEYVTRFDSRFIGLQGTPETLKPIQDQFGLWYEYVPLNDGSASYTVDHSARTYLIDPLGQLRITYSFGTETDALTNSIRQAVQQSN